MIETVTHKGYTFKVHTGEDAFYGVGGGAWAVIGGTIRVVPMNQAPYITIEDGKRLAGVTRACPRAKRAMEQEQSRVFGEFRAAARDYLTQNMGEFDDLRAVVVSCGEICDRLGRVFASAREAVNHG